MSEGGARGPYGPSTDMQAFRELFAKAKNIVALSGAGISAESGVPTFRSATRNDVQMCPLCFPCRGAGGYWRTYQAQQLATPESFAANPSLVWEFYHYRREVMGSKHPNPAHKVAHPSQRAFVAASLISPWVGWLSQ